MAEPMNAYHPGRPTKIPFLCLLAANAGRALGRLMRHTDKCTLRELRAAFCGGLVEGLPHHAEHAAALLDTSPRLIHYLRHHWRSLRDADPAASAGERPHHGALARTILLECEGDPLQGGVTLAWLHDRFVNREQRPGETARDYDRRIQGEEGRIACLVEALVQCGKLREIRCARDDVRYCAPQVTFPPEDAEAAEEALGRYIDHSLAIGLQSYHQHVWGAAPEHDEKAGTRYTVLRLGENPVSHQAEAAIMEAIREAVRKVGQVDDSYQQAKPPDAPSIRKLRVVIAFSVEREKHGTTFAYRKKRS